MTVVARVRNLDHSGATLSIFQHLPNLGYKFARSNTGDAAWSIPFSHAALDKDGFAPKRTDYIIDVSQDNGISWEPVHGGFCGPVGLESSRDTVEVVGHDWLAWLEQPYRFGALSALKYNNPELWLLGDIVKYWINQSQETIIAALVASTWNGNADESVHLITNFEGTFSDTIPVFWFSLGDTTTVLDYIKQIGALNDPYGFDFWMDYNKMLTLSAPRIAPADSLTPMIKLAPSLGNLVSVTWGNEGPNAVTTVGAPPAFPAFIGYSTYVPSIQVYRNWWQIRAFNETIKNQFLTLQATASVGSLDRNPQKNITVVVRPEDLSTIDQAWFFRNMVGQVVEVDSEDWFHPYHRINARYWIDTQALSCDSAGNWICTLTLEQAYGSFEVISGSESVYGGFPNVDAGYVGSSSIVETNSYRPDNYFDPGVVVAPTPPAGEPGGPGGDPGPTEPPVIPPIDPNPPPYTGGGGGGGRQGELCICANQADSFLTSLNPAFIRRELDGSLVSWAAANGVGVMGLGGPLDMGEVNSWPTVNLWEYDNEPYFRGVGIESYAVAMRNFGATFKASYPNKTLIFPCYVQADGGDYLGGGGWKPWVDYIFDNAPDIGNYYDGWGAHPYPSPRNAAPQFTLLDKVHNQLIARGFNKPCYITEVGWSVGGGGDQVDQSTQASTMSSFVSQARSRSWVQQIYYYCSHSYGSDFESGFGLILSGSERIAAGTFRSLV